MQGSRRNASLLAGSLTAGAVLLIGGLYLHSKPSARTPANTLGHNKGDGPTLNATPFPTSQSSTATTPESGVAGADTSASGSWSSGDGGSAPASGSTSTSSSTSATSAPPIKTPAPTPAPSAHQSYFIASSPWNTPIRWTGASAGLANGVVNQAMWTWTIYHVNSSTPLSPVTVRSSWGWPANPMAPIPAGAHATSDSDAEIVVINDTTGQTFDFWGFANSNGTYSANAYGESNIYTQTGFGSRSPNHGAGTRAIGASGLGGLILASDLASPSISHAIAIELPVSYMKSGYVSPAISSDASQDLGQLQEGERLAIPAGTPKPANLSPVGSKVWDAMVKYGAIVADRDSGSPVFQMEALNTTSAQATQLRGDASTLMRALALAS